MQLKILAVIVVVAIVMYTIISSLKNSNYRKLVSYLENGDYDTFDKEIDSKLIKFLFPKMSIMDLKLNAAIVRQNKTKTVSMLDEICSLPLTKNQKETYYMKAFNYFIGLNDKKNAKKYLDLINELQNERMILEANRVYNIYILKNDKDLKSLLEELEDLEDYQKGVNEFLISLIYKNKNDKENALKYETLSKEHLAMVDEETAEKLEGK